MRLDVPDKVSSPEKKKKMEGLMDKSAHTFAASLASQSGRFRQGNNFVQIADALSNV